MSETTCIKRLASPVGDLLVAADASGVLLCEFAGGKQVERKIDRLSGVRSDDEIVDRLRDELAEYFAGDRTQFDVPLPSLGSPFQQAVWQALCDIPHGQTRSYGQQAVAIGNPKAVRAVAAANGQNFRAILIPCHRVIGSNGALTGFGGGLPCKQWLLDHERAVAGDAGSGPLFPAVLASV